MAFLVGFSIYLVFLSRVLYNVPLLNRSKEPRRDRVYIVLSMGVLMVLVCLRGNTVGNDTESYRAMFLYYIGKITHGQSLERIGWLEGMESGYKWLNILFGAYAESYQVFIALIAIFCYGVMIHYIRKYSANAALSVLLFFLMFYSDYTNLLRQTIAISIMLMALDNLYRNNKVAFLLELVVATLFHRTALVGVCFLLMQYIAPTRKRKIMLLLGAALLMGSSTIFALLAQHGLLGIYSSYGELKSGLSVYLTAAKNMVLYGAVVLLKGRGWVTNVSGNNEKAVTMATMLAEWIPLLCVTVSLAAVGFAPLARLEDYFSICYVLLIPQILKMSPLSIPSKRKIVYLILLMLFAMNAGKIVFRPEWVTEYNYRFFFS